jgi:hypothetical protein
MQHRVCDDLYLYRYIDAHLPQPSYDDKGWGQVLPLLRLIFSNEEVEQFEDYRSV